MQIITADLLNSTDFLGNEFEYYKCSRCRKQHRRMATCESSYTCPTCTNKTEEESEVLDETSL
jgi:hypothetical protein